MSIYDEISVLHEFTYNFATHNVVGNLFLIKTILLGLDCHNSLFQMFMLYSLPRRRRQNQKEKKEDDAADDVVVSLSLC